MALVWWCPYCWHQSAVESAFCLPCGADLSSDSGDRVERPIRALGHPLPEVRGLVAVLLGGNEDPRALAALNEAARRAAQARDWELLDGVVEGPSRRHEAEAVIGLQMAPDHGSARARAAAVAALHRRRQDNRAPADTGGPATDQSPPGSGCESGGCEAEQ